MKLSEYKETFYEFSGKASDVSRTAAFAGIALVWIFRIDGKPVPTLPKELLLPTILFALGLGFDLLHYVTATIIWGVFHRYHENRLASATDDPELSHSPWLLRVINSIFALKLVCVLAGYAFLIIYLYRVWLS